MGGFSKVINPIKGGRRILKPAGQGKSPKRIANFQRLKKKRPPKEFEALGLSSFPYSEKGTYRSVRSPFL